jgi:RNA methyltransferase, TrmH family
VIISPDNDKLKTIRKLARRRERDRTGLFVAEGEDLVAAAATAGARTEFVLVAGEDVEPELLDSVSTLGSGTRVIGVYAQAWSEVPGGPGAPGREAEEAPALSLYLHGVGDPGNVGSAIRSAHALCDGPVILGPGCADPYSPKAVRASMGSIFARPPARAEPGELPGSRIALSTAAEADLADVEVDPPVVVCVGAEREGLPAELVEGATATARIPLRGDGPNSLNAAMAATVGLYEIARRITRS